MPLRVPISHFQVQNYIIYVTGDVVSLHVGLSPPSPKVCNVTFRKDPLMGALLGTVHLSPAPIGVTSRPVTVTFVNGAPSVTLDLIVPTATFSCNEGDVGNVTASDVNLVGASPVSAPFSFTAAATITESPPTPTIMGVSFSPAELVSSASLRKS